MPNDEQKKKIAALLDLPALRGSKIPTREAPGMSKMLKEKKDLNSTDQQTGQDSTADRGGREIEGH